ncbi:MAG: hypothetical protein ACREHD_33590 [Pirellulales bacterium]
MIAIWRQLIWKEWREQVWKMIAVASIVIAVEGYLFFSDPKAGLAQLGFGLLCGVPGAFFIALGVAAGERTAGSLDFVRSLPLARWKWAAARLAIGAIASLVPVVAAAAVTLLLSLSMRSATDSPSYLRDGGLAALCCLNVYGWTVVMGVRRSNELRAGLAATCLFIGWWALVVMMASVFSSRADLLMLPSPAGWLLFPDPARPAPANPFTAAEVLGAQAAALVATAWWFTRGYGALTGADNRSPSASGPAPPVAVRPPRRSPLAAMVWKEYRESGPVCLAGLVVVAAVLLPPTIGMAIGGMVKDEQDLALAVATNVIVFMGTIMALVLGVGGHAVDLEAGVWQFWRTRPIRPGAWFWLKFFTGAALLVASFDGTLAALDLIAGGPTLLVHDGACWIGPILHFFAYSAAVWMVCQLRQPIYAGILSLAIVSAVLVMGEYPVDRPFLPWLSVSQVNNPRFDNSLPALLDWLTTHYLPFAASMVALSAGCALLGWFAVRRSTPWSPVASAVPG